MNVEPPSLRLPIWLAKGLAVYYELAAKIRKEDPFLTRAYVDRLTRNRVYNIDKAKNELDYSPKYDFKEAIGAVIKGFRENGQI